MQQLQRQVFGFLFEACRLVAGGSFRRAWIAILQAKRTKYILEKRFLLSEKRVNMKAEITR